MLGADLGELAEDVELQLGDLGDSLDDEVDGREVLELGAWREEAPNLVGLLLGDLGLGDILGQKLVCYRSACAALELVNRVCVLAKARPFSNDFSELSMRDTGTFAWRAATRAMPRPFAL